MYKRIIIILLALINFSFSGAAQVPEQREIKVGAYENAPKIYKDSDGNINGFWPVLINDIAERENWEIVWVYGTWEESLERLHNNEIDLMSDVGLTEERRDQFVTKVVFILILKL